MSMSKLVNVNNIQQLIDLNQDIINFKLDFKVLSENNIPFKAVVVSQSKLDSEEILDFKDVNNGVISGNIIADNGVKQNYYLVLKSDSPTKCTIEINLEEIPLNEDIKRKQQEYQNKILQEQYQKELLQHQNIVKSKDTNKNVGFFNFKTILFLLVIAGGIIFYYLFYMKKQSTQQSIVDLPTNFILPTENVELPIISSNTLDLGEERASIFNNINENLLSRLNNIEMY